MHNIYLLTGTNLGNRLQNLILASQLIQQNIGNLLTVSAYYETAAWGREEQGAFLNQVLKVDTIWSPMEVLEKCQKIEQILGRERKEKWGERTIDIDVLFYGNELITEENLIIPHPYLHLRKFTLIPLAEIAANFLHPKLHKTIAKLLEECPDNLAVKKWTENQVRQK